MNKIVNVDTTTLLVFRGRGGLSGFYVFNVITSYYHGRSHRTDQTSRKTVVRCSANAADWISFVTAECNLHGCRTVVYDSRTAAKTIASCTTQFVRDFPSDRPTLTKNDFARVLRRRHDNSLDRISRVQRSVVRNENAKTRIRETTVIATINRTRYGGLNPIRRSGRTRVRLGRFDDENRVPRVKRVLAPVCLLFRRKIEEE